MPISNPSRRLILVEDSEDDAFIFQWALQKTGRHCDLTHVSDGGAAIELLREIASGAKPRPDVVFLDLKLPVYSGFEVLSWLKTQPTLFNLTVIVLSGSEHAADAQRARELGAASYFVKPISNEQLRTLLEELPLASSGSYVASG